MHLVIGVIREICCTHNLITSFLKIAILYFDEAILTQLCCRQNIYTVEANFTVLNYYKGLHSHLQEVQTFILNTPQLSTVSVLQVIYVLYSP